MLCDERKSLKNAGDQLRYTSEISRWVRGWSLIDVVNVDAEMQLLREKE